MNEQTSAAPHASVLPKGRIKRHTLIIKKGLQAKFVLLVMMSLSFGLCLVGWELYYTFGRDIVRDLMDPGLFDIFLQLTKVLAIKLGIYCIVVALVAVFLSHRLAGPIYRFEKSAKVVGEGDLTHRVYLRKGDELTDLQDEFNAMMDSLQQKATKDRTLAKRISGLLEEMAQTKGLAIDLSHRLKEIQTEIDHLGKEFKI